MSSLNNKFTAKLTTVAPPIKEYKINIYQDSYILSNNPRVNYGEYNAAQIGNSTNNDAAAMIEFSGLKNIPDKVLNNLIDAKVSITYSMKLKHDYTLNVYDYSDSNWLERTIYWENAPSKGDKLSTITLEKSTISSNIDVTELLESQINKEENTLGLYFDSNDEASNSPLCIYTKEHYNKKYRPVLTLRYFDVPGVPMTAHMNGELTVEKQVSTDDNNMEIIGEVAVGRYSVKKDIVCDDKDKLIIPKFTVFDMALTTTDDETLGYESGYDAISNADKLNHIQELFDTEEVIESASTGDFISGEVTVMSAGGTAIINGTIDIPKLFVFTTLFLDDLGTTLFRFPSGTNIADAKILMPYTKTEVDGGEISGNTFIRGFAGHHYINSVDFAVSNPVDNISEITGTLEVAVPRFSNYDTENEEWVDFDDNNIITGEIGITPVVRTELTSTGKDKLKVPKLFTFNTVLKKKNEDEELEIVYTFPKGEDIDNYKYTEPYDVSEQDGSSEISGELETVGLKTEEINGSLLVVFEVPSTDIECEKWDDGVYYKDADFYVLGSYEENKSDDNNIISCEKSNVDHSSYSDANFYTKAMISIPTYYDQAGHILPEKHNTEDVYRIEYTNGTIINGEVGIPHTDDPIIKYLNGEFDIAKLSDNADITCEKSDVDHTNYEDANMYVKAHITKALMGIVTVKRKEEKYINGSFIIGKDIENIDDIECEKSDVEYTNYEDANLYIKGLKVTEIIGSVLPMFGVHEDINGSITVYAKINKGGWIDCDKTEVDGINVKFSDANMYVVKSVEDHITGDITIRGAYHAYINSKDFKVSNRAEYTWINGGVFGLKVARKVDDAWINGNIEIREMIINTIEGTITVKANESKTKSYAYIF